MKTIIKFQENQRVMVKITDEIGIVDEVDGDVYRIVFDDGTSDWFEYDELDLAS